MCEGFEDLAAKMRGVLLKAMGAVLGVLAMFNEIKLAKGIALPNHEQQEAFDALLEEYRQNIEHATNDGGRLSAHEFNQLAQRLETYLRAIGADEVYIDQSMKALYTWMINNGIPIRP